MNELLIFDTISIFALWIRNKLVFGEEFISGVIAEIIRDFLKLKQQFEDSLCDESCSDAHCGGQTGRADSFAFDISLVSFYESERGHACEAGCFSWDHHLEVAVESVF